MENPLVSVIVPTYNRAKHIKKAIDSALNQTYRNIEIIIIDDGSTDETKEVLLPCFSDKRIRYFYQKNQGVANARNNGIKNSEGKYIALLDSDDYWPAADKLEKQTEFLEKHQDYLLVGGGEISIDENGKELFLLLNPETDREIRKAMLFSCLISPSTAVFSKKAWELAGGFNENCSDLSEDWELFLKLGKLGKMYNFQQYFICYLHGRQNRSNFNRRPNLKYNIGLIKKYRADYPSFHKALFLRRFYYLYSFVPFKENLMPLASKIKQLVFGKPAYKHLRAPKL